MTPRDLLQERDLLAIGYEVARRSGVALTAILGRCRSLPVSRARHELWYELREHPELYLSYPEIGRLVDRRHSTVLRGVRAHRQRIRNDSNGPPPGRKNAKAKEICDG